MLWRCAVSTVHLLRYCAFPCYSRRGRVRLLPYPLCPRVCLWSRCVTSQESFPSSPLRITVPPTLKGSGEHTRWCRQQPQARSCTNGVVLFVTCSPPHGCRGVHYAYGCMYLYCVCMCPASSSLLCMCLWRASFQVAGRLRRKSCWISSTLPYHRWQRIMTTSSANRLPYSCVRDSAHSSPWKKGVEG